VLLLCSLSAAAAAAAAAAAVVVCVFVLFAFISVLDLLYGITNVILQLQNYY